MDPRIEIRKITPNDNDAVAHLIKTVMTSYDCVGEGYSIEDKELDNMFAAYQAAGAVFYVITVDQRVEGCGGIGPLLGSDSSCCELKKMYFYPSLRGKGMGRKLMDLLLAEAVDRGYTTCYLETVDRMERARHLYLKYGFQKLNCQEGATGHSGCDTFYKKSLIADHAS